MLNRILLLGSLLFSACGSEYIAQNARLNTVASAPHSYTELLSKGDTYFTEDRIAELRQYQVIFVPGFLSDIVIGIGRLSGFENLRLGEYFNEQMTFLDGLGIENFRLEIESEDSPENNAALLSQAILQARKKVLLVSHSKGSLDSLVAFMNYPELSNKVAGWVSLQGAFYGSPIADLVLGNRASNFIASRLLQALHGSKESLSSLATEVRRGYILENQLRIADLTTKIPVISFASKVDGVTMLSLTRTIMKTLYKLPNDGLVPVDYAILPGSHWIKDVEVDHAVPVMNCRIVAYDRIRLTKALLLMVLERL